MILNLKGCYLCELVSVNTTIIAVVIILVAFHEANADHVYFHRAQEAILSVMTSHFEVEVAVVVVTELVKVD